MKRLYHYISMVAAKLVGRRHVRDVDPPGMKELLNAFVSRSDSAITARPDFDPITEDILAVGDTFISSPGDEYLNSVAGMYGTSDLVWFSNRAPVTWDGTSSSLASSSYGTGTITAASGQKTITGSGTEWIQNAWPGCFIALTGSGSKKYYQIDAVNSDTELTVTVNLDSAESADDYEILKTHQPDHADYKLNIQSFTTGLVYSSPTITMPVESKNICGPFYASVVETLSEEVFVEFQDDDVEVDDYLTASGAASDQNVATDGNNWMCIAGRNGADQVICKSTDPDGDWEAVTVPTDFTLSGFIVSANTNFYVSGKNTSSGKMAYAYTQNVGTSWIVVDHDTGTNLATTVAVTPGGRVMIAGGDLPAGVIAYYTDDNGSNWSTSTHATVPTFPGDPAYIFYDNSTFVCAVTAGSNQYILQSSDGATFSYAAATGWVSAALRNGAYSPTGDFWIFTGTDVGKYWKIGGDFSYNSVLTGDREVNSLVWAGDKFIISDADTSNIYSTTNFVDFELEHTWTGATKSPGGMDYSNVSRETVVSYWTSPIAPAEGVWFAISGKNQTTTTWNAASFEPLSDIYRALSHSILDGYVVLFGTREYQSSNNTWEYFPRRIRWTAPLTYNDFSSSGSGSANLDGNGAILDARTVNGRIVTFESSSIGALSPRGYATDPWEYDQIKNNIRAISNPVVVDDLCYFIDDSGLLRATNGIAVESPPFSFDLTEYDDFNADSPIWLTYSPELESLVVYNPDDANRYVYLIDTEGGTVARIQAASLDLGGASSESPKSVVCVENSSDRRLMLSYNPDGSGAVGSDAEKLLVAELSTGDSIDGIDEWTTVAAMDTYHNQDTQTPEISIVPEGTKTGIKHIIARTYTDGTSESTNPILVMQCKSVEDAAWHDTGDRTGTITVDTSTCTGSGTAWSNTIGASGGTVYTTPCLATQARIYVGSTLQTAGTQYTVTDTNEITFGSATSDTVYAYWENEPSVRAQVGDFIQTTEGWHRITSITNATTMLLDHYLTTGSDATATHHPGTALPTGDGEVKIGISKLVEGVQLRFLVFHRSDGDATVTKITGATVGHIPSGEKIVKT